MPDIRGLDEFEGELFHSSRWNHDYDLEGKTVAVVGTGASSIQFVPRIAPKVAKLHLFQRTPPWIMPKADRPMKGWEKKLFSWVRPLHWLHRAFLYWMHEVRVLGFLFDPRIMKAAEKIAKKHLASAIEDSQLRAKLTPSYTMGCKRILISNDYYPAVARPNVDVVTDGILRVTKSGVMTRDGQERKVDAIICGTGFSATAYLAPLDIYGRSGRKLNDVIQEKPDSYLGITVNDFPNLFLMMGPNTGLGHNSMVFMIEAQARYALKAIKALRRNKLSFIDVREDVQHAFSEGLQARLKKHGVEFRLSELVPEGRPQRDTLAGLHVRLLVADAERAARRLRARAGRGTHRASGGRAGARRVERAAFYAGRGRSSPARRSRSSRRKSRGGASFTTSSRPLRRRLPRRS